jgi:hypothetical protein
MGPLVKINPELVHATSHALSLLLQSRPRVVEAWNNIPPVLIFTDGAAEEDFCKVTHGAVLLDPWSSQAFSLGITYLTHSLPFGNDQGGSK